VTRVALATPETRDMLLPHIALITTQASLTRRAPILILLPWVETHG